jgi:hypothetical protein
MRCKGCGKEWKDDAERMVFLNRFVRSRRKEPVLIIPASPAGRLKALKERAYQATRFSSGDEPEWTPRKELI